MNLCDIFLYQLYIYINIYTNSSYINIYYLSSKICEQI